MKLADPASGFEGERLLGQETGSRGPQHPPQVLGAATRMGTLEFSSNVLSLRCLVDMQRRWPGTDGSFSHSFVHSSTQHTFTKHLLCFRH